MLDPSSAPGDAPLAPRPIWNVGLSVILYLGCSGGARVSGVLDAFGLLAVAVYADLFVPATSSSVGAIKDSHRPALAVMPWASQCLLGLTGLCVAGC